MRQMGNFRCQLEAFSPWGKLPLANRTNQVDGLGSASRPIQARRSEVSYFDPFLDLRLDYSNGTPRLVRIHGVESNRGEFQWNEKIFPNPQRVLSRVR